MQERVRKTIELEETLIDELKILAAVKETSLKEYIEQCIVEYVDNSKVIQLVRLRTSNNNS